MYQVGGEQPPYSIAELSRKPATLANLRVMLDSIDIFFESLSDDERRVTDEMIARVYGSRFTFIFELLNRCINNDLRQDFRGTEPRSMLTELKIATDPLRYVTEEKRTEWLQLIVGIMMGIFTIVVLNAMPDGHMAARTLVSLPALFAILGYWLNQLNIKSAEGILYSGGDAVVATAHSEE